VANMGV